MKVHTFVEEGLGNSAHLVISERDGVAALIDPLRDVDQYQEMARREGVRITHVFEPTSTTILSVAAASLRR